MHHCHYLFPLFRHHFLVQSHFVLEELMVSVPRVEKTEFFGLLWMEKRIKFIILLAIQWSKGRNLHVF